MLRWMDGLEHTNSITNLLEGVGGGAAWSEFGGSGFGANEWSISTANPATGTNHLRLFDEIQGATTTARRAYGAASQVSGFGYRFQTDDLPSTETYSHLDAYLNMAGFRDVANGEHCRIGMGTEGSVFAVRNDTLLGRSDPCIAAGGYHHFEVKSKIDNTTGYIECRVNEVTVLNVTGVDTQNTGNAASAQIAFGQRGDVLDSGVGFNFIDFDDIFAWDDNASDPENTVVDFVGDKGCYYLPVNGDTAEADWVLSTGATGYTLLDEVIPSGTDYVNDTTGVARSIFQVAALPANVAEVIAMMPVIYARKEESGTVGLRGGVVVGSDESYTPTNSPSTAYAYMEPGPKTIDPATGVAWANTANPDLLIERTV